MATSDTRLSVRALRAGYGKKEILQNASLDVATGEVVALLGANGAGKTTLINTITGFIRPTAGQILVDGMDVTAASPHRLFARGVVQVSQTRDLFPDLSVVDNLTLGSVMARPVGGAKKFRLDDIYHYFPRLRERARQRTSTLSGGEQQMVAIGRALMGCPKLLLLDEPLGGLAPQFVQEIGRIISSLRDSGSTMLLVEQNIAVALDVADKVLLLRSGVIAGIEDSQHQNGSYHELVRRLYF